jgi:hypothetical protein
MEKRQPLELKIPMAIYNFGATALSLYCFTEVLYIFYIPFETQGVYFKELTVLGQSPI